MAKIRRIITLALALALALTIGTGCQRRDPADDVELYWPEEMQQDEGDDPWADVPDTPSEPEILIEAFAAPESRIEQVKEFKKQNPDAVGWLYLPDTAINEVVVQTDDNTTYHRANSLGEYDFNGCLYADYESRIAGDANRISPNIVIYGHSMTDNPDTEKDEKKFTQLKKLLDKDFAETHPYIFFSSSTQDYVYEVFAAMYTNSDKFYYIDCALDGTSSEIEKEIGMDLETLVETAKAGSIFDYPVTPQEGDKVISLSTCTYKFGDSSNQKQRFVVFGRLLTAADDMPEKITLTENADAVMPTF